MRCPDWEVPNTIASTPSRAVYTEVIWTCVPGMRYPDTTTRKAMYCQADETWKSFVTEGCRRK